MLDKMPDAALLTRDQTKYYFITALFKKKNILHNMVICLEFSWSGKITIGGNVPDRTTTRGRLNLPKAWWYSLVHYSMFERKCVSPRYQFRWFCKTRSTKKHLVHNITAQARSRTKKKKILHNLEYFGITVKYTTCRANTLIAWKSNLKFYA